MTGDWVLTTLFSRLSRGVWARTDGRKDPKKAEAQLQAAATTTSVNFELEGRSVISDGIRTCDGDDGRAQDDTHEVLHEGRSTHCCVAPTRREMYARKASP